MLLTLLPKSEGLLGASEQVDFDLVVTDGELTSLLVAWNGGENSATAELRLLDKTTDHTPPQAVRAAIASGEAANAPEIGDDLARLADRALQRRPARRRRPDRPPENPPGRLRLLKKSRPPRSRRPARPK